MNESHLDVIFDHLFNQYDKKDLINWLLDILPETALIELYENINIENNFANEEQTV